ncbi:type II secretion system protein [Romboutsia sp.]|uniref:type II secretion system protein n=1 Tax=Romboutsia sp. TaxID=1965302 RepID=UPI003F33947E
MFKNLKKKKNNKGFTLVELLVVIAIIGILAVVAVPSLFKNIDKSKAVQVTTNINAIKTEILAEYADGKTFDEIKDTSAEGKVGFEILKVVPASEKKAGETYDIVAADGTDKGVRIKIITTEASDVLGRVNKQFGATTDDATDEIFVKVAN